MAIEVHVEGQVIVGQMPNFAEAMERYKDYAKNHAYAIPDILIGLSGEMNTVRLVYHFERASDFEEQEARTLLDREYGEVAGGLGFRDQSLNYSIYRPL